MFNTKFPFTVMAYIYSITLSLAPKIRERNAHTFLIYGESAATQVSKISVQTHFSLAITNIFQTHFSAPNFKFPFFEKLKTW